jgi:heterodisulfide reductase subunit B2
MNRYALFLGCQIPARVKPYEIAARAVLDLLGVRLVDIRQFNCCGYPMRNADMLAFLLSAARNLALAERAGLDLLVLCQCCYGSLKKAQAFMTETGEVQNQVRRLLQENGLAYTGWVKIKHLLSVLYHDVGIASLKRYITKPQEGLPIATHYGCHLLRPSDVTGFDDPVRPTLIDTLVETTGAKSVAWQRKLECCGSPVTGIDDALSANLTRSKVISAREAGARYICTACPYCHLQFGAVQRMIAADTAETAPLPPVLFTQLLGRAMGLPADRLGIA